MDWDKAEQHLIEVIQRYLHQGSLGVSHHVNKLYPLLRRLRSGERSQGLYDAIMREN